jgi:hypothetical protein
MMRRRISLIATTLATEARIEAGIAIGTGMARGESGIGRERKSVIVVAAAADVVHHLANVAMTMIEIESESAIGTMLVRSRQ